MELTGPNGDRAYASLVRPAAEGESSPVVERLLIGEGYPIEASKAWSSPLWCVTETAVDFSRSWRVMLLAAVLGCQGGADPQGPRRAGLDLVRLQWRQDAGSQAADEDLKGSGALVIVSGCGLRGS